MKIDEVRRRFFDGVPRYRWRETLGQGAVGVVFKAWDTGLEVVVAIKVLSPSLASDEQAILARFKREIALNRRLKHPNVARMFDYGVSGDFPFITMEFVEGKDLWSLTRQRGRIPPAEAVPILRQIARAAAAMHACGILHRDLKSQNVLVDGEGAVAVLDLGLARAPTDPMLTADSVLLGTPHYMSPEQARGTPLDARSDLYSIGIIAYEVLTGRLPFEGDSPVVVAMKHVTDPIPDLLFRIPEVSPALRGVVMKALEKDRARRFASADEMERALALLDTAPHAPREKAAADLARFLADPERLLADIESALDSLVVPAPAQRREPLDLDLIRQGLAPEAPPPPAVVGSAGKAKRPLVLVVHDDVRELLKIATAVATAGCRTHEARSGAEALEALFKESVDLVLMSADLPGMDGFDTTRVLRSQPRLAPIPVILTTPKPNRSQLAFAVQSGAADLLARPLSPHDLEARLWPLLERRGWTRPRAAGRETPSSKGTGSRPRPRKG